MARAENINPFMLKWARETAGYSVVEAAEKIGLSDSKTSSAEDKLRYIEEGRSFPTRSQLLRISNIYRRPISAFYMESPPVISSRGEDFRTIGSSDLSSKEAAALDALLRDIRARQDMVRSILEDDEDYPKASYVGSIHIRSDVAQTADAIRSKLGFKNAREFRKFNGADALFNALRDRVERIGVFVLLVGNLGSHHSNISEQVFRGFAIADDLAPFIVINDQDAKSARSFTLIHELAHIFVGSTGISGAPTTIEDDTPTSKVEKFCNDVAAEFLLPATEISNVESIHEGSAQEVIRLIAESWNVSEPMVAYRLLQIGKLSGRIYRELASFYAARWRAFREKEREKNRETEGGPTYYVVRKHRLGRALLSLVARTLRENELTHTKAAKMLGVKPSSVEPLLRGADRPGSILQMEG